MLVNGKMFSDLLLKKYGISKEQTDPFFTGEFQECLVDKADLKETIAKHLESWGWKKSVDELLDEWFKFEHNTDEELVEYLQFLRERGFKVYLATNQEKYRTQYILNKMGFGEIFDNIFSSAHVGHKKPSQEFFESIMKHLDGINKEEIVFWDDQQKNIEGAKEFGFHAEVYTSLENFKNKMEAYLTN